MSIARVTEIVSASPTGWKEAVDAGVARASKTLRNIVGVEVLEEKAKVEDGRIVEYRVRLKITFVLEA
ncbi:MAG: dodecin domain-containing protein [Myxococcales bacterium]|nr:dodecin domain-containing protein [Myxococcales bacterium]